MIINGNLFVTTDGANHNEHADLIAEVSQKLTDLGHTFVKGETVSASDENEWLVTTGLIVTQLVDSKEVATKILNDLGTQVENTFANAEVFIGDLLWDDEGTPLFDDDYFDKVLSGTTNLDKFVNKRNVVWPEEVAV